MLTWKQLIAVLNAGPPEQLEQQAFVYPPKGCPCTDLVPITGVYTANGALALSTGKQPQPLYAQ
jgi:hypothetical protein